MSTCKCSARALQPIATAATTGPYIGPPGEQLPPGHLALNTLDGLARRMRLLSAACEGGGEQVHPRDLVAELSAMAAMAQNVASVCGHLCALEKKSSDAGTQRVVGV